MANEYLLNENAEVVVYGVEFLRRLDKLLPQFEKRRVVNYLEWCWFFKTMLRDLPDPFALTIFKFYKTLNCRPSFTSSGYIMTF
ncbi:NEDD8 protease Nep2 [Parelaphostrongylus tenuis]|uniref:NEDD8 protease Nep2 n=1 Tax=Parelaphostrongylus tenuis TaxID=148309 RepID=A0AAD5R4H8_PARTN|nr:NEDD8 protease Nep2 [Parelaphostrongylus tenuis]